MFFMISLLMLFITNRKENNDNPPKSADTNKSNKDKQAASEPKDTKAEINDSSTPKSKLNSQEADPEKKEGNNNSITVNKAKADENTANSEAEKNATTLITGGSPVSSNMDFQALLDRPECKEMKGMIEM